MERDVIVVGAGLAGLRCARVLGESGLDVEVLEAADAVGGRQRSEQVDGFTVDRGFHVVNPAYPALRRAVDLDAVGLHGFGPGVQVRVEDGVRVLTDPRRDPRHLAATLRSGLVRPGEVARLVRWLAPVLARPGRVKRGPDAALSASLDAARIDGPLRRRVLEPFLAGVLLDDSGGGSAAFARLLLRMFALGTPGLPAGGVQRLPERMASGLDVRLDSPVEHVHPGTEPAVVVAGGERIAARRVVLAVAPQDLPSLAPQLTAPGTRGVTTWWFAADAAPSPSTLLLVDGRQSRGPIVNTAVVSNAVTGYAPAGQHLVEASCLLEPGSASVAEADVRRELGELWGADTGPDRWDLLARHEIPHALPRQPVPLSLARPQRVAEGVLAAGDHLDTASIQGALVSGERAARAVVADLSSR